MRGSFIVVEGVDGAGKTSVTDWLVKHLGMAGVTAEAAYDPGTAKLGAALRPIILDKTMPMTPHQQVLLYTCARSSLADELKEKIHRGITVVCDRWVMSTLVYQGLMGIGGVEGLSVVKNLHATHVGLEHDCIVVLDVDPKTGFDRKEAAGDNDDRFDVKDMEWKADLRAKYRVVAEEYDYPIVDASADFDVVVSTVWDLVRQSPHVARLLDAAV